jgi:HrpA-like RNA helicase
VHWRRKSLADGDFLLALLRALPARRRELGMPPLKLIVMSATLDAGLFCGYLGQCPVVQAAGRTHPVTTVHLEDIYDTLEVGLATTSHHVTSARYIIHQFLYRCSPPHPSLRVPVLATSCTA